MKEIKIARDFSKTPWWRYIASGPFSWEQFYEEQLKPIFESLSSWEKLRIDFDDTYGYPPSFMSESFGRLYKNFWQDDIWERLELVSNWDKSLIDIIYQRAKEYV
jgi:uncharacterized protein with ParB-like and HNH nuclease domain